MEKRDRFRGGMTQSLEKPTQRPNLTLLEPEALEQFCKRSHIESSEDLTPYVSVAWTLQWSLRAHESFTQRALPNPCIHIVVDFRGAHILGVVTGAYSAVLTGARFVFGMKFRPGGFHLLAKCPVSALTDREFPLTDFFADADEVRMRQLAVTGDGRALMDLLECELRNAEPRVEPALVQVDAIVERIASDGAVLTVEAAASAFGLSPRALQRLFHVYIGVGPKWVIRRFRLQEAAARAQAGTVQNWAELACALGYFDQSHFINEFTKLVGQPPAEYSRSRSAGSKSQEVPIRHSANSTGHA